MWLKGFSLILLLILKDYEASIDFFFFLQLHGQILTTRFSTLILEREKPVGLIC